MIFIRKYICMQCRTVKYICRVTHVSPSNLFKWVVKIPIILFIKYINPITTTTPSWGTLETMLFVRSTRGHGGRYRVKLPRSPVSFIWTSAEDNHIVNNGIIYFNMQLYCSVSGRNSSLVNHYYNERDNILLYY